MPDAPSLSQIAEKCLMDRYGTVQIEKRNNQTIATFPDGRSAIVKTGNNGSIMQKTRGTHVDAEYIGVSDVETVVIAVRAHGRSDPAVYEVPGEVYRERMTKAHIEVQDKIRPTNLRVLRFDGKSYPEQQVAQEWSDYRIDERLDEVPVTELTSSSASPGEVLKSAKEMVAAAFGVTTDQVNITVNA